MLLLQRTRTRISAHTSGSSQMPLTYSSILFWPLQASIKYLSIHIHTYIDIKLNPKQEERESEKFSILAG